MPTYIEYKNEDGSTVLIELAEATGGIVKASRDGISVVESGKKFKEAFASIRGTMKDLVAEMDALHVEEGEVKFGLKALAEAGVFVVGKVGGEMNYEVTLRWKKPEEKPKPRSKK
jgi:Trypsin-co-occurring domain 1